MYAHIVKQLIQKLDFFLFFLNMDIPINIPYKLLRFDIHKYEGHFEGSMNFDLVPTFYSMHSRKKKKLPNVTRFLR